MATVYPLPHWGRLLPGPPTHFGVCLAFGVGLRYYLCVPLEGKL